MKVSEDETEEGNEYNPFVLMINIVPVPDRTMKEKRSLCWLTPSSHEVSWNLPSWDIWSQAILGQILVLALSIRNSQHPLGPHDKSSVTCSVLWHQSSFLFHSKEVIFQMAGCMQGEMSFPTDLGTRFSILQWKCSSGALTPCRIFRNLQQNLGIWKLF